MEKIKVKKINEVHLKIDCNLEQSLEIKEFFSCYAPNYRYHPKFRQKIWDGKISFYNRLNSTIPLGLYSLFKKFCYQYNYEIENDFNTDDNSIKKEELKELLKVIFEGTKYQPKDYQEDAIYESITKKRGIIEAATGAGKSLCIYVLMRFLLSMNKKILLIVPNINLTNQMFNDFLDYGWNNVEKFISILYNKSNKYDDRKPILISTWQSLFKKNREFFDKYDAVIVDETHLAKCNSIKNILDKCWNSEYRIGFTGTLPDEKADLLTIYGYLGYKLYEIKTKELQIRGDLSDIMIANILIKYPEDKIQEVKKYDYEKEVKFLSQYEKRNEIFNYILKNINSDENVLILCQLIDHLQNIKKFLEKKFPDKKIYEIYGKIKPEEREYIRQYAQKNQKVILLGTYMTMSTGFNLPNLHHIIFASSYKSKIKVLQSIGRGLRTFKNKKRMILWDLVDDLTWKKRTGNIGYNHVYKHFLERLKYYKLQEFKYINKLFVINN
jgi:superfamily II DNA or RNA helicase